jgi:hypothetical protein
MDNYEYFKEQIMSNEPIKYVGQISEPNYHSGRKKYVGETPLYAILRTKTQNGLNHRIITIHEEEIDLYHVEVSEGKIPIVTKK